MREFTMQELVEYDGKNGKPAYVAIKGMIYDITGKDSWESGNHFDMHSSGMDLTEAIDSAPHGDEVFANSPVVGTLKKG